MAHRRFCLNITKRSVNMGVPKPWPRLPREADLPVSLGKVLWHTSYMAHGKYRAWTHELTRSSRAPFSAVPSYSTRRLVLKPHLDMVK